MIFVDLIYNLALLVALSVLSGFIGHHWRQRQTGALLQGLVFGIAAVIGMLRPLVLMPGLIFDGRSVMISLCGLFFGPLAVTVSGGMAIVCRIWQGGMGALTGVCVIVSSMLLGWLFFRRRVSLDGTISIWRLLWFGLLVHVAMLALMFTLPFAKAVEVLQKIGLPVLLTYPLATVLIGKILSDHAAQRHSHQALQASEEKYRLALSVTSDGLWDWNVAAGTVAYSPAWGRILGLEAIRPELAAWESRIHPDDRAAVLESLQTHLEGRGERWEMEHRLQTAGGAWKWVLGRGSVVARDAQGKPLRMVGTMIDIDRRKQAELALRQTQAILQAALDQSPAGIAIADAPSGVLRYVNDAGLLIRGGDRQTVVDGIGVDQYVSGWRIFDLDGRPLPTGEVPLTRALLHGETCRREFMVRRAHADDRIVVASAAPIRDDDGQVTAAMVVFMDMTEQKQREVELRQKNEEITRFIYTVSHDLRTPLITIKAFLAYIDKDVREQNLEALATDMGYVRNAADKMGALLDELLELSRVGRKVTVPEEVPLGKVAQAAIDLVAGSIAQRGVEVVITGPPVILYGDMQRLMELYQNLLDNAIKFMGDQARPRVEIGATAIEGVVTLFVRDNGIGIDPCYQHKLFGLFEKLEPKSDGVGMGLAIVKRIVEVHGGTIRVESRGVGQGSAFFFTLANSRLAEDVN